MHTVDTYNDFSKVFEIQNSIKWAGEMVQQVMVLATKQMV